MKSLHWFVLSVAVLWAASTCNRALAVPTLDGSASAGDGYGTALSTQDTDTQFGNSTSGDLIATFGSEIDQIFAKVEGGRLYVVVAGNLQDNFNKLQIFIDSDPNVGVNQISTDIIFDPNSNVPYGFDRFCCGGDPPPVGGNLDNEGALQRFDDAIGGVNGFKFDDGFTADYTLAFTHGGESVGDPNNSLGFWAMSAHYADLTQGTAGAVVAAGIQLAPTGSPNVLRGPLGADFNEDGDVNGDDFLAWQRGVGQFDPNTPATKADGDANGDGLVNAADLALWESEYGTDPGFSDFSFVPFVGGPSTEVLIGPALPGLLAGELIDRSYAQGAGGCTGDTDATGCVAPELEFVLNVPDPNASGNLRNHRNFENTINLELAFNNSNTAGVNGCGDPNTCVLTTTGDPGSVITGVEFSIPLIEIGSPDPNSVLKIAAFVNGTGYDFSSNQYAGDGVLQVNLGNGTGIFTGDLAFVDLSAITGDQFVSLTVPAPLAAAAVPEPTSVALLGIGAACGLLNRKRRS